MWNKADQTVVRSWYLVQEPIPKLLTLSYYRFLTNQNFFVPKKLINKPDFKNWSDNVWKFGFIVSKLNVGSSKIILEVQGSRYIFEPKY